MGNGKQPVGRPSKGIRKIVQVKMAPTEHAKIKAFAKAHKIDMMQLMRLATLQVVKGQVRLDMSEVE
jgi:hypothetical protein